MDLVSYGVRWIWPDYGRCRMEGMGTFGFWLYLDMQVFSNIHSLKIPKHSTFQGWGWWSGRMDPITSYP